MLLLVKYLITIEHFDNIGWKVHEVAWNLHEIEFALLGNHLTKEKYITLDCTDHISSIPIAHEIIIYAFVPCQIHS